MELTPAELEACRSSLDLRVDANGQLLHDGQPIAHPGVRQALLAGLEVLPNGQACVRIGAQLAYVQCGLTPFVVAHAQLVADGLKVQLNTGRNTGVDVADLKPCLHNDAVLVFQLGANGPLARCGHAAWMHLSAHLEFAGEVLELRGPGWAVPVTIA